MDSCRALGPIYWTQRQKSNRRVFRKRQIEKWKKKPYTIIEYKQFKVAHTSGCATIQVLNKQTNKELLALLNQYYTTCILFIFDIKSKNRFVQNASRKLLHQYNFNISTTENHFMKL